MVDALDFRIKTQRGYDAVARAYAQALYNELADKPFDRVMLDWFAARVVALPDHAVCDMGCGPGQIARYLKDRGVNVRGLDLSPAMVQTARDLNLDLAFDVDDMTALTGVASGSLSGIAAFYAIVNIPRSSLASVFSEWRRVLHPDGIILFSFHVGEDDIHVDALFGEPTDLDFFLLAPDAIKQQLARAGLLATEVIERDPYPHGESQTRRCYIFATPVEEAQ